MMWVHFLYDVGTFTSLVRIDGLVQERLNSIADAMELHLSCINPSQLSRSMPEAVRVTEMAKQECT